MSINDLHARVGRGDTAAEEQLFQQLSARFRAFAHHRIWNSADAEDVAQEALLTVRSEYRTIEFQTSFSAWAHRVLENKLLAYIEMKRRTKDRFAPLPDGDTAPPIAPSDPLLKRRLLDCFRALVDSNRMYARILALHYQGCDKREICDRLNLTRENSYVVMSRARGQLRKCLEGGGAAS